MKNISLERFVPYSTFEKPIEERTFGSKQSDINLSSIYSQLIKLAARYCDSWASDIIIDIEVINNRLQENMVAVETGTETHLFGFRKLGVDHNEFIFSRLSYANQMSDEYLAMWRLDFSWDDESGYYGTYGELTAKLYEVVIR